MIFISPKSKGKHILGATRDRSVSERWEKLEDIRFEKKSKMEILDTLKKLKIPIFQIHTSLTPWLHLPRQTLMEKFQGFQLIMKLTPKSIYGEETHGTLSPGLHAAADPGLAEECATLGGCRTGIAKVTNTYDLPARRVIHTVGPKYAVKYHTAAENALSHCYRSCLELLIEKGLQSIAMGCIYTEAKNYPREPAAHLRSRMQDRCDKKQNKTRKCVMKSFESIGRGCGGNPLSSRAGRPAIFYISWFLFFIRHLHMRDSGHLLRLNKVFGEQIFSFSEFLLSNFSR
ncbi:hypothetical protein LXL04_019240 [Taraxacum kok-saghyz]